MRIRLLLPLILILAVGCVHQPEPVRDHPIRLGVDLAGSWHMLNSDIEPWTHEPFYDALRELGVQDCVIHLIPETVDGSTTNGLATARKVQRMDRGMRAHGLTYALNVEDSNFMMSREVSPYLNEFATETGEHRWDLRIGWVRPFRPPLAPEPAALRAVIYDEPGMMQQTNNQIVFDYDHPDEFEPNTYDVPYLASTHGLSLEAAWDKLVARCEEIRRDHYKNLVPVFTEQLWPDMFHIFARGGWGITPKLLKENFSPLVLAIAMGAAIQYPERTSLLANIDMHFLFTFPGHSPESVRSAMLLAYWTGVDGMYVENLDFSGVPGEPPGPRHPEASPGGALLTWDGPSSWSLTKHGQVVRDFYRGYVPEHPRRVDWRNYKPRLAIVRLTDGSWGMLNTFFRDRMLGNRDMPEDDIAREWINVWKGLVHAKTSVAALSYYNWFAYPEVREKLVNRIFVPLDSVAVFDHKVTGAAMDSVECFVVCGHALSAETYRALKRRAAEGARVIIARRLQAMHSDRIPKGDWHVVDSFGDGHFFDLVRPYMGPPDRTIYRFEDQIVVFREDGAEDRLAVTVYDRTRIPEYEAALKGEGPEPDFADLNGDGVFDIADLSVLKEKFVPVTGQ